MLPEFDTSRSCATFTTAGDELLSVDGLLTTAVVDHDLHELWGENTSQQVLYTTLSVLRVVENKGQKCSEARNENTPAYVTSHPERQTAEDSAITGALDTARASLLLAAVQTPI